MELKYQTEVIFYTIIYAINMDYDNNIQSADTRIPKQTLS